MQKPSYTPRCQSQVRMLTSVTLDESPSRRSGGSFAHELHSSGIPVVVASQFPLTFAGSAVFTGILDPDMLAGDYIRDALYATRSALYQQADVGHDWASLVAYVQLPEDYDDRLVELGLQTEMASLSTAQLWSDHLTVNKVRNPAAFEEVAERLRNRIDNLDRFQNRHQEQTAGHVRNENLGLLGSAEKRLAELYFHRAQLGDGQADWIRQAEQALRLARSWYEKGFVGNLSHHWTGVQALSLEAVLTGGIGRVGRWYAAVEAAETDSQREGEVWALGSLAELYLLAPLAGQGARLDDAGRQLDELARRMYQAGPDRFPVQSTKRQLERYVHWWTKENGYFGGSPDLAGEASQLLEILSRASKQPRPRRWPGRPAPARHRTTRHSRRPGRARSSRSVPAWPPGTSHALGPICLLYCRFSSFLSSGASLTWPDASCLIDLSPAFSHRICHFPQRSA